MSQETRRCGDCQYWSEDASDSTIGECHRDSAKVGGQPGLGSAQVEIITDTDLVQLQTDVNAFVAGLTAGTVVSSIAMSTAQQGMVTTATATITYSPPPTGMPDLRPWATTGEDDWCWEFTFEGTDPSPPVAP